VDQRTNFKSIAPSLWTNPMDKPQSTRQGQLTKQKYKFFYKIYFSLKPKIRHKKYFKLLRKHYQNE